MPFASHLGVGPLLESQDYFDSLKDIAGYIPGPARDDTAGASLAAVPKDQARLVVCHDYKGGYMERDQHRQYTFRHFDLVDTFIYFSHHRVSAPPQAWTRIAHEQNTSVLGTLIFEHDSGKADLDSLLGTDIADGRFASISTAFADQLVSIAIERGFEGYLVNVEVPFGIVDKGVSARDHIDAMVTWLAYLRSEISRRIPNRGEIMWYDGANESGVRWQNCLSPLNAPFLNACDSIFINYFWRDKHVKSTGDWVTETTAPKAIFGIDVHGRGQLGGGGFNCGASAHAIRSCRKDRNGYSLAIFAPAWTEESEHLGTSLTRKDAFQTWLAADEYFWRGGPEPVQLEGEKSRLENLQREERGVMRARQLAAALHQRSPSALPPFNYQAPLEPLPGAFEPLSQFSLQLGAVSRLPYPSTSFNSHFGVGSGHDFWFEGKRLNFRAPQGWTDVDLVNPRPVALDWRTTGATAKLCEEDAYLGATSLLVDVFNGAKRMPLYNVQVSILEGHAMQAKMLWKPLTGSQDLKIMLGARTQDGDEIALDNLERTELQNGWKQIVGTLQGPITICTLTLETHAPIATFRIGWVSIAEIRDANLWPRLTNLRWSEDDERILWDVNRVVGKRTEHLSPVDNFVFFIVKTGSDELLATTVDSGIRVEDRGRLKGECVECFGVLPDGSIQRAQVAL
ncbi:hypothetical protein OIV83_000230 [Microbotryomycetes sp. JL201]|nr:hypothetical protein OIV83_000230 [Microbotryomycetes sp. JL201]